MTRAGHSWPVRLKRARPGQEGRGANDSCHAWLTNGPTLRFHYRVRCWPVRAPPLVRVSGTRAVGTGVGVPSSVLGRPESGVFSSAHTDFPSPPGRFSTPQRCVSASTSNNPRPCVSSSPGIRTSGVPAPASLTSSRRSPSSTRRAIRTPTCRSFGARTRSALVTSSDRISSAVSRVSRLILQSPSAACSSARALGTLLRRRHSRKLTSYGSPMAAPTDPASSSNSLVRADTCSTISRPMRLAGRTECDDPRYSAERDPSQQSRCPLDLTSSSRWTVNWTSLSTIDWSGTFRNVKWSTGLAS